MNTVKTGTQILEVLVWQISLVEVLISIIFITLIMIEEVFTETTRQIS